MYNLEDQWMPTGAGSFNKEGSILGVLAHLFGEAARVLMPGGRQGHDEGPGLSSGSRLMAGERRAFASSRRGDPFGSVAHP